MSINKTVQVEKKYSPWRVALSVLATILIIGLVVVGSLLSLTPVGQTIGQFIRWLFAADSVQIWWYVTRSAGIIAYLLLWLSTVLGLAVASKYMDIVLDRMFTYDFHEFISLLSVSFLLLHVVVLLFDRFLPYSLAQVLVPFLSPYRPVWVGIGVISFYVIALVTVTFYMKRRIGMKAFRVIHVLSLLGYLGGLVHGVYSGTDTALPAMQLVYKLTGLAALFFTIYYAVMALTKRAEKKRMAGTAAAASMKKSSATR